MLKEMVIIVNVVIVGQLFGSSEGCDGANIESCWYAAFQQDLGRYKVSSIYIYICTVKPLLHNGHFGTRYNFTVIQRLSSLRGKIALPWSCRDHRTCPL